MSLWYYYGKLRKHGPVEKEELLKLFKTGKLKVDTLVWKDGLDEWKKAISIDELNLNALNPPPLPKSPLKTKDEFIPSGPQIRPVIRSLARGLDMSLYSIITVVLLVVFINDSDAILTYLEKFGVWSAVPWSLMYMILEFILLSAFGTTLGKALFKIRLRKSNGDFLSYYDSLRRSADVWVRGLGCYIPFVSWATFINFERNLKNEGITLWDRAGEIVIQHQILGRNRIIVIVGIFASLSGFFLLL